MLDARLAIILRAGENIDSNALPAKLSAGVPHIDIHAARLLAAQQSQRTGMHAEHSNAA
jgi:hypothetical protein